MEQRRFSWEQSFSDRGKFFVRDIAMHLRIEEVCNSAEEAEKRTNELNSEWEDFSSQATDEEIQEYWSRYPNYSDLEYR